MTGRRAHRGGAPGPSDPGVLARGRTLLWHLRRGGIAQARTHLARARRLRSTPQLDGELRDRDGRLTFAPWPLPDRSPRRPGLRVATILDDFSALAFRYEWDQVPVTPSDWRRVLAGEPVDLLFVESAWHGNRDAWQYHLTGPSAPRPALMELVDWCRAEGVPTVFWNKEDPAHYADFLPTARLFDHVFTTDSTRLPDYRRDLGHDRVGVLPFAAQPAVHNPVRPARGHQSRDIGFGGMYFAHRHPERREQMDLLLGAAAAVSPRMEHGLEIFSRYLGGDPRYQFPAPLDSRVVGSLTYERMLSAYRAYKVFLNVNSVVDSPSMCARRIFEITASGTPVISTPSPAITNVFADDEVLQVADRTEAEYLLRALVRSPELRDRMVHRAQRRIWSAHTYSHRVEDVLRDGGITGHRLRRPNLSALVSTNRPHQLEHVLRTVGSQVGVTPELVLLTHGFDPDPAELRARAAEAGVEHLTTLTADPSVPLGACLNLLVEAAGGDVVTKMDDDDLYGRHYLSDQLYALDWSGADVVGKHAHYLHLGDLDAMVLRFPEREHRYTDFVVGPTLMTRRDFARANPFPHVGTGEDTGFLRTAVEKGASIYAADRFGFVQVRQPSTAGDHRHTWDISTAEILANSDAKWFGHDPAHVMT